ncbi:MAG TPA: hypothetical protein VNT58_06035, partial [Gaiellaceae bacterium]|nr:hypothetical protein [Gaiellaceae bacterium]
RTIAELELALVATPASDPTADDRRFYLDALREYAEPDGRLDPAFEPLIHEVFADTLPERS